MAASITLSLAKGSPLTDAELDGNFTELKRVADATEAQAAAATDAATSAALSVSDMTALLTRYAVLDGSPSFLTLALEGAVSPTAPVLKVENASDPNPANLIGYSILSSDTSSLPANGNTPRPRLFQSILSVEEGVSSTRVHENLFSSVYVTGSGTSGAEINQVHAYFENKASGPVTGDVEGFEASMLNNGTMATYMGGLVTPRNGSTGTIAAMIGMKFQYAQDNLTPGAVGAVNHIDIEAKVGDGSVATTVNALRIADPHANIVTNGRMIIGSLAMPNTVDSFWIKGEDNLESTFAVRVQNHSAQDLLWVTNAGNVHMRSALKVGSMGTVPGTIFLSNATSGTIQIQTPPTGPLGSQVLTLPVTSGTLATTSGTTTDDDAAAGQIGEYISSTVLSDLAVPLTNNIPVNVTSIELTAGDWEVTATLADNPAGATSPQNLIGAISITSGSLGTSPASGGYASFPVVRSNGVGMTMPLGVVRLSLAATTTVYLVAQAAFTISTNTAYGFIGARRVR